MELTQQQLKILRLVAQGYNDPEIAGRLRLHRGTATLRLRKLAAQIGVTSLAQFRQKARQITDDEPRAKADHDLTEREARMLHLLATGHTNRQIGTQLHLATSTVRDQVSQIYRKLGVTTRPQAAARAVSLGLSSRTR